MFVIGIKARPASKVIFVDYVAPLFVRVHVCVSRTKSVYCV